jgi:hypothetical protein
MWSHIGRLTGRSGYKEPAAPSGKQQASLKHLHLSMRLQSIILDKTEMGQEGVNVAEFNGRCQTDKITAVWQSGKCDDGSKDLILFILVCHTSKLNYKIIVNTVQCDFNFYIFIAFTCAPQNTTKRKQLDSTKIKNHNKLKKKGKHHCKNLWGLQRIPQHFILTEEAHGHKPHQFKILNIWHS